MNVTPIDRERGFALFFWRRKKLQDTRPNRNPENLVAARLEAARKQARWALRESEIASDKALEALKAGRPADGQEVHDASKAMRKANDAIAEWVNLGGLGEL